MTIVYPAQHYYEAPESVEVFYEIEAPELVFYYYDASIDALTIKKYYYIKLRACLYNYSNSGFDY